jgi:hypothetical protein
MLIKQQGSWRVRLAEQVTTLALVPLQLMRVVEVVVLNHRGLLLVYW